MKKIIKGKIKSSSVKVPPSKSYTHRAFIAASLSGGASFIKNALISQDTMLTKDALEKMGVKFEKQGHNDFLICGAGGAFKAFEKEINLENSGTSMRLLLALAALGEKKYIFTGSKQMQKRPVGEIISFLSQLGIDAKSLKLNNCPPVCVYAKKNIKGGKIVVDASKSSQFLSSLLFIAPFFENRTTIYVKDSLASKPYIDLTLDVMRQFKIDFVNQDYRKFEIAPLQKYIPQEFEVESDLSQASYFWAIGALLNKTIFVENINKNTKQGDIKFLEVLEKMGAEIIYKNNSIGVRGENLKSVTVDMHDMPDLVPTLAILAAFARGKTTITNVAHLKIKETDRLFAIATELKKIGVDVIKKEDGLIIYGCKNFKSGEIFCYNDHRIAMSFAICGLLVDDIVIKDELCVEKSFPNYWEIFESLYER